MRRQDRYKNVFGWFQANVPIAETELHYSNPYELLIAVILSAQCTDKRVNQITPALYEAFPKPEVLAASTPEVVYEYIKSVSYPHNKAKHLVGMAKVLTEVFHGIVPSDVDDLQKLPGVGAKTAERYAFTVLGWSDEEISELAETLVNLKKKVKKCTRCGNLTEDELCEFCKNSNRNQNIICVVQNPKDISVIESMQQYNGVYHVLDGLINTQKGVLPDQLNIMTLLNRVNERTEEVILALDPTVEGETTALYISKLLEGKCRVSRLAHGIPVGSHLDYTDAMTLLKAFEGRKSS